MNSMYKVLIKMFLSILFLAHKFVPTTETSGLQACVVVLHETCCYKNQTNKHYTTTNNNNKKPTKTAIPYNYWIAILREDSLQLLAVPCHWLFVQPLICRAMSAINYGLKSDQFLFKRMPVAVTLPEVTQQTAEQDLVSWCFKPSQPYRLKNKL